MITWKDRHRNNIVITTKTVIKDLEIKIKRDHGQWFLTTYLKTEITPIHIAIFDTRLLTSSLLDDAKNEALAMVITRLTELRNEINKQFPHIS